MTKPDPESPLSAAEGRASIRRLALDEPADRSALVRLLDEYARGPSGGGHPLAASAMAELPARLAACPTYLGWLAWWDDTAVGIVNCFEGLSTFRARPLLNIHDISVSPGFQRRGIASRLLATVAREAIRRGCCKMTLEVLSGNQAAIAAYRQAGFAPYALDPAMGQALFLEKMLPTGE